MDTKKKQLMKKKRHRHFWNRFFGFMLVLLLTIGGVQTIASGNLAIDDVVLEVEDYSVAEFMEADPEPAYVSIVPMIESAPVTTAAAFRAAILNPDYTVINIGASFSVAFSGTGTNSVPTLTRSVRINGHGHTITATNAESVTTLGVVADPTTLTLDNITFTRTGTGLAYIFAAATTTANWTVRLQDYVRTGTGNVTAGTARHTQQTYGWIHPMTWRGGTTSNTGTNAEPNRGGLVNAQSSRVVVAGIGNRLGMHGAAGGDRHHLWVRDFEMLANASLYITSGGDSGGAIRIANSGAVDIREHANLNIQNVGTRDVSPAITVATVSGWAPVTSSVQSNGLSGSIGRTTLHAGANVHIEAHYHAFVSVVSHDFEMKDGAVMNLITNHARGIGFLMAPNLRPGDHANPNDRSQVYNVSLQGEGTQLNIFSNNNFVFNAGASFTLQGNNSSIVVEDGATMQVYGARTSAVVVSGTGTVFDV
ncbi:MAG: hypothetical protein FWE25_11360, partial [Lachnospiraceae bacterium]|nr:hypothetical protein [Lachnospiraceae bacterium]